MARLEVEVADYKQSDMENRMIIKRLHELLLPSSQQGFG